jgi:hypothetical protein
MHFCECFIKQVNLRGIEFPSDEDDAVDGKVLVECGMCHTIALMPLALSEEEFVEGETWPYPTERRIPPRVSIPPWSTGMSNFDHPYGQF